MILQRVKYENFTVLEELAMDFCPGINILIGENGTGKTHVLKTLYSACQSTDRKTSFSHKLVSTMLPDDYKIARLVTRKRGRHKAAIRVAASGRDSDQEKVLSVSFSDKTRKWDADVTGEEDWEETFHNALSVFIPAKEILSHSYNLNAAVEKNNVQFDDTYLDVVNAAKIDISPNGNAPLRDFALKAIESVIGGTVSYDAARDEFYLQKGSFRQEFNLVAEGIRKMGLIWQLIRNGALERDAVLFWDEPEANINPASIPLLVDVLLTLQRQGVQIFVSTHDYLFASYFAVKQTSEDSILYHSLSFDENGGLRHHRNARFADIEGNSIIASFNTLLNEIYKLEI